MKSLRMSPIKRRENIWKQNQKASISKDGFIIIEDTVTDDMELRFWIRGFGDSVEVIKPKKLRDEFKTIAKRMNKLYE